MKYQNIKRAIFESRPNRFIAYCLLDGKQVTAHVRNTGRCREILIPGTKVYLEPSHKTERKTPYSLVGAEKGDMLINIDSTAPNKVVFEALSNKKLVLPDLDNIFSLKKEAIYNNSRFDFYIESETSKALVEVKGVTLEENGVAMFPDAPTERGVKHIEELMKALDEGYLSYMLFIIQMKGVKYFRPNFSMHRLFGETLAKAKEKGVKILAYDCNVTADSLEIADLLEVRIK